MRHQVDENCKIEKEAQDIMKDRYHHQEFTAIIKCKVEKIQLKVKKILLFKSEIFENTKGIVINLLPEKDIID